MDVGTIGWHGGRWSLTVKTQDSRVRSERECEEARGVLWTEIGLHKRDGWTIDSKNLFVLCMKS